MSQPAAVTLESSVSGRVARLLVIPETRPEGQGLTAALQSLSEATGRAEQAWQPVSPQSITGADQLHVGYPLAAGAAEVAMVVQQWCPAASALLSLNTHECTQELRQIPVRSDSGTTQVFREDGVVYRQQLQSLGGLKAACAGFRLPFNTNRLQSFADQAATAPAGGGIGLRGWFVRALALLRQLMASHAPVWDPSVSVQVCLRCNVVERVRLAELLVVVHNALLQGRLSEGRITPAMWTWDSPWRP